MNLITRHKIDLSEHLTVRNPFLRHGTMNNGQCQILVKQGFGLQDLVRSGVFYDWRNSYIKGDFWSHYYQGKKRHEDTLLILITFKK